MLPLRTHARALHYRHPPPKRAVAQPSKIFLNKLKAERNTAFIRVGGSIDFLRSPAEAFALIRDVERRFGPLQEFNFQRDSDQNTRYQSFVFVAFKDPASYQRLPAQSKEFTFKRPSADFDQPGGAGLEDLKPFLESQTLSESEDLVPDENTVPYIIQRSASNMFLPSMYTKAVDVSSRTAQSFLEWGGFHPVKPISSETVMKIENAFSPTSIDNFRMRCALRRYSEMISLPNPYEVAPGQEVETTLQEQEVLQVPDHEITSQKAMSNDVQVQSQMPDVTTSSDVPPVHSPSSTPSTSTPSSKKQPDTASSATLESSPPSTHPKISAQPKVSAQSKISAQPKVSAQPKISAQESVATSPSPTSYSLSTPTKERIATPRSSPPASSPPSAPTKERIAISRSSPPASSTSSAPTKERTATSRSSSPASSPSSTPIKGRVATSPSPSPAPSPLSTPTKPSTTLSESVAQADAIATKMQQQAKSMKRAKKKKEERKEERRANPLPDLSKKKPAQPSMKGVNKRARQAADTKPNVVEEKPKTVREKISGFFSSFF